MKSSMTGMASKARAIAQATLSVVASGPMSPSTSLALALVASLSMSPSMCFSQEVDHWEAVLQDGTQWRYWLPNSQPANDWMEGGFSDAAWPEGPAGFGYGDGDDNTVLPSTPAVYLRHTFEIDDLNQWLDAHFYMDYDDGFVAYLNGTEIGRGNAGQPGDFIAWNQGLDMDQEAVLYAGGTPSSFPFDLSLLTEGPNTLAIEIHNVSPTSSDLTARPFLFAGVPEAGLGYGPPPTWFSPPGADMHPVTFEVNMTNETVSTDGVYVAGGGYFGVPGDNPMTDADGDGTWTATIEVPHGFTGYYTFVNGNCADWSCKENIAGLPCAHPEHYNDRQLTNVTEATSVLTCFGQCTDDGTCALIEGCMDSEALNFFPDAALDDSSCVYFTQSNLPIVVITTAQAIMDDPRIIGNMKVLNDPSGINELSDDPTDYDGLISIEIRGSSSQLFPKKSYAFETQDAAGENNNVSLLGMPEENDWILYGPYTDKSLMRNALVFELGDKLNRYTPRRRYCEVFVNNDYRGVYMLMENIKRDANRVDIATLLPEDIEGDELTGGYILKLDKFTGDFEGGWSSPYPTVAGEENFIQFHKPEADELNAPQMEYIEGHITAFEDALAGPDFADSELGYKPFVDMNSFVDLYLINELSKNIDGYRFSTYFYKQKDSNGGKIVMGPWWDYNLAMGNVNYCEGADTEGFEVDTDCGNGNPFWWERMLEDPAYRDLTRCLWEDYRSEAWSHESIHNTIDSLAALLEEANVRDFARWPRLGEYVWPNAFVGQTYEEELEYMRDWIDGRLAWLDANILGQCTPGCTDSSASNFDPEANYDDGSCEPSACPGDINGDFSVTVADMLLLLGQFDCTTDCPADLNEDGAVGVGDLLILLAFFGTDC